MKVADFDIVFKVDFNDVRKYKKDLPAVWGNIVCDDLVEICFKNFISFFPDSNKVSDHFAKLVKCAMSLTFGRINRDGSVKYPLFNDFLTAALMIIQEKDIQNKDDKKIFLILMKLIFTGEVVLKS